MIDLMGRFSGTPRAGHLNLSGMGLTEIPSEIFKPHYKYLESLDLSDNGLSGLPAWITKLYKLDSLNLSFNNFTSVPPEILNLKRLAP